MLVPKLAIRLIMDDIKVEEEEVRKILEESRWIGDLLCEDYGNVVDEDEEGLF